MVRVHRIPFSTNVERVALAAGYKGLDVEWVDHDPADRAAIRALSGQDLVPVAELDGDVVVDSMRIVERLEKLQADPALYPARPRERARLDLFVEWFNEVWKGPPNEIDDELDRAAPDRERIARLGGLIRDRLALFEGLLSESKHLLTDDFGAADACAFPFLKYAAIEPAADDTEPFHRILADHQSLDRGAYPRLRDWIARVDALPRG
jgi:glutathione S-transferase